MCEEAASLVDERLETNVVPPTRIVRSWAKVRSTVSLFVNCNCWLENVIFIDIRTDIEKISKFNKKSKHVRYFLPNFEIY